MKKNRIAAFFILLIGLAALNIHGQDMPVPLNLQAALFKKIFSFDKTLQASGNSEVIVLSADGTGNDVVSAFSAAGVSAKLVQGTSVPDGAGVVYVMPGTPSPKQQTAQKKVLSISGVTAFVESGQVAVGLGTEGGKPKIIVNLSQLKAEGHELSADLLNIAKVIQ